MINEAGFSLLFTLLAGSRYFVHGQDAGNTETLTGGGFGLVSMFVIFVFCLCGTYLCVSFTCCYEYFCQPDENSSECCSCRRSSDKGFQQKNCRWANYLSGRCKFISKTLKGLCTRMWINARWRSRHNNPYPSKHTNKEPFIKIITSKFFRLNWLTVSVTSFNLWAFLG